MLCVRADVLRADATVGVRTWMTVKRKKKKDGKKERKKNLLNTNPGARICERTRCMCVWMRMSADGVDADGGGGE